MEGKLSGWIVVLTAISLVLNAMIFSGCMQEPVGPQEAVGPEGPVGPQEPIGVPVAAGPQAAVGPQTIGPSKVDFQDELGMQEPVNQRGHIGPAYPVMLVARVLKLIGLATQVD